MIVYTYMYVPSLYLELNNFNENIDINKVVLQSTISVAAYTGDLNSVIFYIVVDNLEVKSIRLTVSIISSFLSDFT